MSRSCAQFFLHSAAPPLPHPVPISQRDHACVLTASAMACLAHLADARSFVADNRDEVQAASPDAWETLEGHPKLPMALFLAMPVPPPNNPAKRRKTGN